MEGSPQGRGLQNTMNRRDFLKTGTLAATALAARPHDALANPRTTMSTQHVKFCAFADLHYYPGVFPHDTPEWLGAILRRAESANVDFIIHAGDFTHRPAHETAFVRAYNDFHIKTYHTIGNHDDDGNTHEQTLQAYGLQRGHYHFDCRGFRFIILDDNYFRVGDEYHHFSSSNYYKEGSAHWIPPEQVAWFRETVESSPWPCVTFCHGSFERPVGSIHNYEEMQGIVNAANRAHPGRVRLCVNGHHHRDCIRIQEGVVYLDLNSANYDWVPKRHACYSPEVLQRWRLACNTVMWNDPISAIITLDGDGTIDIQGATSSLRDGVTAEMTGNARVDACGRPTTAVIQSARFRMRYDG